MKPKIIDECRNKMYAAIMQEIDRDPQHPAVVRVDIKTKAGDICIWCDSVGNMATVTHKGNNNDSERLEEAIENCIDFQDVMDDWLDANPQDESLGFLDSYNTSRLDELMLALG